MVLHSLLILVEIRKMKLFQKAISVFFLSFPELMARFQPSVTYVFLLC